MRRNGKIIFVLPESAVLSERCFLMLLAVIWAYQTLGGYVVWVIERLPLLGHFHEVILPTLVVVLAASSLGYLIKKICPVDILFYMVFVSALLLTALLKPANAVYIQEQQWQISLAVVPMYYVGVAMSCEKSQKVLYWVSIMGVLATFAYQMYVLSQGRTLSTDSMSTSYKALPSTMYLIYWAFRHRKLIHWLPAILGCLLAVLCGTRGPIVAIVVYVFLETYLGVIRQKVAWKRLVCILLALAVVYVASNGDLLEELIRGASETFEQLGFSTRIFDRFLEGSFSTSKSRVELAKLITEGIWEKPFFGHGIMGDRVITEGRYAHNIALEFWCHYGVILGSILLASVFAIPLMALAKNRGTEEARFLLMLSCTVLIKLLLSNSYLLEPDFFLLMGLSVQVARSKGGSCNEKVRKKSVAFTKQ